MLLFVIKHLSYDPINLSTIENGGSDSRTKLFNAKQLCIQKQCLVSLINTERTFNHYRIVEKVYHARCMRFVKQCVLTHHSRMQRDYLRWLLYQQTPDTGSENYG